MSAVTDDPTIGETGLDVDSMAEAVVLSVKLPCGIQTDDFTTLVMELSPGQACVIAAALIRHAIRAKTPDSFPPLMTL